MICETKGLAVLVVLLVAVVNSSAKPPGTHYVFSEHHYEGMMDGSNTKNKHKTWVQWQSESGTEEKTKSNAGSYVVIRDNQGNKQVRNMTEEEKTKFKTMREKAMSHFREMGERFRTWFEHLLRPHENRTERVKSERVERDESEPYKNSVDPHERPSVLSSHFPYFHPFSFFK